jgi:hypothetical protein
MLASIDSAGVWHPVSAHLEAHVERRLRQHDGNLPNKQDRLHPHSAVLRRAKQLQRRLEQLARQLLTGAQEHRRGTQPPQDERLHARVGHVACRGIDRVGLRQTRLVALQAAAPCL